MRVSKALRVRRETQARAEREAAIPMPDEHPQLMFWAYQEKPYYIAVSKHGFGVDQIPAMAIRLAQTEVPARARESQLLIYRSVSFVEPVGFKDGAPIWPADDQPRLCGLTTTHRGYRQSPR